MAERQSLKELYIDMMTQNDIPLRNWAINTLQLTLRSVIVHSISLSILLLRINYINIKYYPCTMGTCCFEDTTDKSTTKIEGNNPKPKGESTKVYVQVQQPSQNYQKYQKEISELNRKLAEYKIQINMLHGQLRHQNDSARGMAIKKETLIHQQAKVKGQIQGLRSDIAMREKIISDLKLKLQRATSDNEAQKKKSISSKEAFSILANQAQGLRERKQQLELNVRSLEQKLNQQVKAINYLKNSLNAKNQEQNNLKSQIVSLQAQLTLVIADRDRVKNELQKSKEEIIDLKRRLADAQAKYQQQSKTITALQKEIEAMKYLQQNQQQKANYSQRRSGASSINLGSYFVGDVLDGEDDYKDYLITILQQRLKTNITGTRLLYRYDPLNKTNFHKYIDNHDNIVIVIKLANGFALAAWSEGSFYPKMVSDKDGLLFSLTNRKVFEPLKANSKVITYDEFFLIFGNSQLRLKNNEKKVFSNFGVNNAYFASRGEKIDLLLGSGTAREVELNDYEIFQLKFK